MHALAALGRWSEVEREVAAGRPEGLPEAEWELQVAAVALRAGRPAESLAHLRAAHRALRPDAPAFPTRAHQVALLLVCAGADVEALGLWQVLARRDTGTGGAELSALLARHVLGELPDEELGARLPASSPLASANIRLWRAARLLLAGDADRARGLLEPAEDFAFPFDDLIRRCFRERGR